MISLILFLVFVLRLVLAQSTPNVVTPTASAVGGHQTYHINVGDGPPRFHPSRLSANVGDSIRFQVQDLSCTLRSSYYPCGGSGSALIEDKRQFVLRDMKPRFFFCDLGGTDGCLSDLLFTLNAPRPPSQNSSRYGTARASTSSRIMSSSHVESSSIMNSAQPSTSPYTGQSNQDSKTSERPTLHTVPGRATRTTSVHAPTTIPPPGTQLVSVGTIQIIDVKLACVIIGIFCVMNMLY